MEMKSATRLLLARTEQKVWERGEHYANFDKVNILRITDKEIEANVLGNEVYRVFLKFVGNGIRKTCTCPYPKEICKHIVATAIVWDRVRNMKTPTIDEIESYTITPPPISRRDINKMFEDPLNADLNILRIAVDYYALSSKEHSQLPHCPKINLDENEPLSLKEIQRALKEMERWTRRALYHSYFCAGEMAAAFCELLDVFKKREPASNPAEMILIMAHCVDWYYRKFNQIVDGSDGVWLFPQVRIGKIVSILKEKYPSHPAWSDFRKITYDVGNWWGEPDLDETTVASWQENRL